tara:strand:+ start:5167 stop:5610 length:444 start_codon:yes stop_codon:yes gene_type:complete
MSIIDTAKKLLRKGIALNDEELINMANSLLEVQVETETPAQPELTQVVKKEETAPQRVTADEFAMGRKQTASARIPVNDIKDRENKFFDDRTEHVDIETPHFVPTERRHASKLVSQKCQDCNQIFEVHESHKREWFVCDSCLSSRRR